MTKIAYIISNYKPGAPIGPMLTSRLYLEELYLDGLIGPVIIYTDAPNAEQDILSEFAFASDVKIVYSSCSWPILFRPIFNSNYYREIRRIYRENSIVVSFWYPGLVMALSRSMLNRSVIVMMDSQVKLIQSTLAVSTFRSVVLKKIKIFIYKRMEDRISKFAKIQSFVSSDDVRRDGPSASNIVITKLPLLMGHVTPSFADTARLPVKILIPRPDKKMLFEFIQQFRHRSTEQIEILLNDDLHELANVKSVTHIKFIKNYDDFYSKGGLVVLLDQGGAGTTNRLIVASKYGLPFISTPDGLRGHDFEFPNLLLVSNSIEKLANAAAETVTSLKRCDDLRLASYIAEHRARNAVRPLALAIREITGE